MLAEPNRRVHRDDQHVDSAEAWRTGLGADVDLFIPLDRVSEQPLRDQLYRGLREAIVDGRLEYGSRLPASRSLAKSLAISRFTVDDAYSRLISDGYAE